MKSVKVYELYDALWYKPWWLSASARYAFVALVCFVLLMLARYYYKKYKQAKVLSPFEQALTDLHNLRPEDFHGYERHKEFYSHMTHILKVYLGKRYSLNVLDKTDYELLKDVRPLIGSSALLEKLEAIMNGAVWAKFSAGDVAQKKMAEHLADSVAIVQNTDSFQVRNT